jgi:hypothetical protein
MVVGKAACPQDHGPQLGDAAATGIVEMHERKAGLGHRILQERNCRCRRQAVLAGQMQKSADQAVAAVSVVITASRPASVVGEMLEDQVRAAAPLWRFPVPAFFDRLPMR